MFGISFKKLKNFLKKLYLKLAVFFQVSTHEAKGLLLFSIIAFILILIFLQIPRYKVQIRESKFNVEMSSCELDTTVINNKQTRERKINFFEFDPNLVTKEELIELGLGEKTANTLIKFRSKGGKFKRKEDLLRIYGMDEAWYKKVENYIVIKQDSRKTQFTKDNTILKKLDLNRVDSLELVSIHGIGPRLASRIIKYRKKLGGFVSVDQLNEVYGFSSTSIQNIHQIFFISHDFHPTKIMLNKKNLPEIYKHPYLGSKVATFIKQKKEKITYDDLISCIDTTKIQIKIVLEYIILEQDD